MEYSCRFDEKLNKLIRERDNYTCQLCGKTKEEEGKNLCVHHIDYIEENVDPANLITLCGVCNSKVNSNREHWKEVFGKKAIQYYGGKIMLLGDLHLSERSPERRQDNYFVTQLGKLDQIISICRKRNCKTILQSGDFFNSPRVGNYVISEILEKFAFSGFDICVVAGQHDIFGHTLVTLGSSPLKILETAGTINVMGKEGFEIIQSKDNIPIVVYGASFGEDIPVNVDVKKYNILIVHQMIGDKPLYPGQDILTPMQMLKRYKQFSLILCGDYHYRFIEELNGRFCINPGALVRKTVAEKDLVHEPAVVYFDINSGEMEVIKLKVSPINIIFDLSEIKEKKNSELAIFIESLKTSSQSFITWKDILLKIYKEKNVCEEIKNVIDECMIEIKG